LSAEEVCRYRAFHSLLRPPIAADGRVEILRAKRLGSLRLHMFAFESISLCTEFSTGTVTFAASRTIEEFVSSLSPVRRPFALHGVFDSHNQRW
jgi:hypothetical protein